MATPLTVSVVQASEDALDAWLTSQLLGVKISDEWPAPRDPFPAGGMVTILRVGQCQQTRVTPYVLKQVDDPYDVNSVFYWKVAACEQPLQLDVWTTSKPLRDDILNRLATALTAGKALTLSPAFFAAEGISPNQDPVALDISLQLAAPWDHLVAAYMFDEPETSDTPRTNKIREFRGTYHGTAWFDRTVARSSPRIKKVHIAVAVSPLKLPPPTCADAVVVVVTSPPQIGPGPGKTVSALTYAVQPGDSWLRADATQNSVTFQLAAAGTYESEPHTFVTALGQGVVSFTSPSENIIDPQTGNLVDSVTLTGIGQSVSIGWDATELVWMPW